MNSNLVIIPVTYEGNVVMLKMDELGCHKCILFNRSSCGYLCDRSSSYVVDRLCDRSLFIMSYIRKEYFYEA